MNMYLKVLRNKFVFLLLFILILVSQDMFSQVTEKWVARYAGPEYDDYGKAIAIDSSGNVYVTGIGGHSDYLTVKYDSSGIQQWVARYDSPGNYNDVASALAIDDFGNVYVTGGSASDYATIKYSSDGVEQWVARYDGPGDIESDDYACAITLDSSGNVYVTGESYGSGTQYDYATIKYNSVGIEQWVARYNGPGGRGDRANGIATDSFGNVYVTGSSASSGIYPYNFDYATIKYDSSGVQQWVARYDSPGNYDDEASALVIDDLRNVYVTGISASDYATVKYNSEGIEQWAAGYDGPGNRVDEANAIAIDALGNVYVTGSSPYSWLSPENPDYATIKYNNLGIEEWVVRYNGPGNADDMAQGIVLDDLGNVYVTGSSDSSGIYPYNFDYATIKYDSSGVQQWVARYNGTGDFRDYGNAITIDSAGNIYIVGESEGSGTMLDYATIKYNNSGVEEWVARYEGPGGRIDEAKAIAVDSSGNVYITGDSLNQQDYRWEHSDFATVKYSRSGIQQWAVRYDYNMDFANAIAINSSGNVYVTGYSGEGSAEFTVYDYTTIKYDSSGVEQWVAVYNGPGNGWDQANAIALDNSGNVYVTGYSGGSESWSDYATIKYNNAGVGQWVARYNGDANEPDWANAIALDNSGNVYITGASTETYPHTVDYLTIKYNNAGAKQWANRYNGPGNDYDKARAISVDGSGNVYVTGYSIGSGTAKDFATVKYGNSGFSQWVARYNGPGNGDDEANAMVMDDSGNIYVTGYSTGSGTFKDYTTIKYNSEGIEQWVDRYNGPGNYEDYAYAIVADSLGNVYVTGESIGSGTAYDYTTIKYSDAGIEEWVMRYDGLGNNDDKANAIALDSSGNVYVTGSSIGSGTGIDYVTIKYSQGTFSESFYLY